MAKVAWVASVLLADKPTNLAVMDRKALCLADRYFFGGKETLRALVCPQSASSVQVMESLRTRRNIRYITWMMDDHVVRYVSGRWAYAPGYRKMFKKHLCHADTVFVISPVMQELYEREFGVKSEVLFAPADMGERPVYEVPCGDGPLKVAYFGRMWDWQLDGLVRFASALEPGKQRLDVYSPDSNLPVGLRLPSVKAKGFLPRDAVPETMRKYAAVLLPLSLGCAHRNLEELSIATKMSESVAGGTITIIFGPQYAAMVRFLQSTGATCVMTEESLVDWPIISARLKNPEFRRQMLDAGRTLLETELSTRIVRARWRSALCRFLDGRDDFLGQAQSHPHGPAGLGERLFAQRSLEHQQDENSAEHTSRIPDGRNGGPSQAVQ
jgi:glycosyltransferase involved in cell wall biosynthesis